MVAGQINLLKERAVAVAQLVRSLKAENESLKNELLSAQSQINFLTNEITCLHRDRTTPGFEMPNQKPTFRNISAPTGFHTQETPDTTPVTEPAASASKPQPTPAAEKFTPADADTDNCFFVTDNTPQTFQTKPQTVTPSETETATYREFDPFFDTFSQFESDTVSDTPEPESAIEEPVNVFEALSPQLFSFESSTQTVVPKEELRLNAEDPAPTAPDKPTYPPLDIFY